MDIVQKANIANIASQLSLLGALLILICSIILSRVGEEAKARSRQGWQQERKVPNAGLQPGPAQSSPAQSSLAQSSKAQPSPDQTIEEEVKLDRPHLMTPSGCAPCPVQPSPAQPSSSQPSPAKKKLSSTART